jgi:4-hydroxybenzoate polyprenyltransferase
LKRKLFQRLLLSLLAITLGVISLLLNPTDKVSAIYLFIAGTIILIVSITIYLRKSEKEDDLSKEYDERDALVEGQASKITMQCITSLIIVLLFLSNFIVLSVKAVLLLLIVALFILNTVTKFFYERVL